LRKCWKYYEECYKIIEEYKGNDLDEDFLCDTIFVAGVYYFAMSLVPPAFIFVVEIVGFQGDRKKGWQILHRCAKRKSLVGFMASTFIQAIYQFYFQDYEAALVEFQNSRVNFPDVVTTLWMGAIGMRQLGRAAEADKYFEQMISEASEMKQALCSLHYELATTAIKLGDWQKSIKNLEYYLKETSQPERSCIACYELGISYACAGDNENAQKFFNLALQRHKKDSVYEAYASRKCQEFTQKGALSNFDKIIYEARQRLTANGQVEVIKMLTEKLSEKNLTTPDEKAVYNFTLGACYHKTKEVDTAFKFLVAAYKEKVKNELWVQPFSLMEMAELEFEQKKPEQAKKAMETIENYKNYNFQGEISQRVKRLTDKLNGVEYKVV